MRPSMQRASAVSYARPTLTSMRRMPLKMLMMRIRHPDFRLLFERQPHWGLGCGHATILA